MANSFISLLDILANVPDTQADTQLKNIFLDWRNKTPRLVDIITTRNEAAYTSACSTFVITVLNIIIENYEEYVNG